MSLLRRLSTRRYPHLLLIAGVCSYRSINPSATVAAVDRRDRQTDRQTDGRPTVTETLLRILWRCAAVCISICRHTRDCYLAVRFADSLHKVQCRRPSSWSKACYIFYPIYPEGDFLRETFETICHAIHGWYLQEGHSFIKWWMDESSWFLAWMQLSASYTVL